MLSNIISVIISVITRTDGEKRMNFSKGQITTSTLLFQVTCRRNVKLSVPNGVLYHVSLYHLPGFHEAQLISFMQIILQYSVPST